MPAGWPPWAWAHTGFFCAACLGACLAFPWPGGEVLILSHFPILVTLSSSASASVFKIRLFTRRTPAPRTGDGSGGPE